ncbi:hypothetical protein BJ085DRAFT_29745 [Dimargaris cristalligena]|uniref:Uncharacterized protein n=1 Tax=Dimargaris cristalligena TaxID=215637 RepID=A0A4Q0A2S8_9FUNG|nr:hypothetical protein BJ085DRAFT_29745 [Dimargaris cristalligena]|eukprot:RKP40423.1 hypothetical protein BJ085DRAFT_29745 [Dimargaris cristalligena]
MDPLDFMAPTLGPSAESFISLAPRSPSSATFLTIYEDILASSEDRLPNWVDIELVVQSRTHSNPKTLYYSFLGVLLRSEWSVTDLGQIIVRNNLAVFNLPAIRDPVVISLKSTGDEGNSPIRLSVKCSNALATVPIFLTLMRRLCARREDTSDTHVSLDMGDSFILTPVNF